MSLTRDRLEALLKTLLLGSHGAMAYLSIFAVLVAGFLLCYPFRNIAYEWPRFLIPAIPILIAAHRSIVPVGRRFWWLVVLANASVLGTAWMWSSAPYWIATPWTSGS